MILNQNNSKLTFHSFSFNRVYLQRFEYITVLVLYVVLFSYHKMLNSKTVYEHIHPKKYFKDHVLQGIRPDGRKLLNYRPMALNVEVVKRADGSATLKIGNAVFICGINAELCDRLVDNPFVITMSSPVSQVSESEELDKLILCSDVLSKLFKDLNIVNSDSMKINSDLYWVLYCDILCVNYDGALFDGGLTVLISALKTLKLPSVKYCDKTNQYTVDKICLKSVIIDDFPVATTYGIFESSIVLVDPSYKEEQLCSFAILTVILKGDEVCLIHKHGSSKVPEELVPVCINQAKKRIPLVKNLIKKVIKSKK